MPFTAPAAVEVIPYALPFEQPYVTARGTLRRREMILLRLHSRSGVVGLGEAVPLSLRGGASLAELARELERWGRALTDAAPRPGAGGPRPDRGLLEALTPPARSAARCACEDLLAKEQGVPLWRHLGAGKSEPIRCNATLTIGPPADVAEQASEWAAEGFESFKLKVGVAGDTAQVSAVRSALGPGASLRVDANGSWSVAQAVSKLELMAGERIELAEQPCASLEELAQVRQKCTIPIAADESVASERDAEQAVAIGACDLLTVKLAKTGALGGVTALGTHLPIYLSSALDGPIGIAAAAHVAQLLRESGADAGIAHGLGTQRLFAATIAAVECELRGASLHLPAEPGLGVQIDERALSRHRL